MVEISNIRKMELQEVKAKLEQMDMVDVGLTLFWLAGFMSEQDREYWDKFCEGIQASSYYPRDGG
ncbi:hypothetical protein ES703_71108 [subsurface metagenome]